MANAKHKLWKVVQTATMTFIHQQMAFCMENSASRIFCDRPDLGKTVAARMFVANNPGQAFYMDCSQHKNRLDFIRGLAQCVGLTGFGRIKDVRAEFVEHVRHLEKPLIILDELGDLKWEADLELKAIWNDLERQCGWYGMGAQGLKKKFEQRRENDKVGYAELFRRFGSSYQSCSPREEGDWAAFFRDHANKIIAKNCPAGAKYGDLMQMGATEGRILSLDRLRDNIVKTYYPKGVVLPELPGMSTAFVQTDSEYQRQVYEAKKNGRA